MLDRLAGTQYQVILLIGTLSAPMLYCSPRHRTMTEIASRGLWLWIAAPALRQVIAIVCALAFVSVSVAHGVQHFSTPTAISSQADVGSQDDGPDPSNKASVAFEHCQGCSMIATVVIAPSTVHELIEGDLPTPRFNLHRPHSPVAETPPPIASI